MSIDQVEPGVRWDCKHCGQTHVDNEGKDCIVALTKACDESEIGRITKAAVHRASKLTPEQLEQWWKDRCAEHEKLVADLGGSHDGPDWIKRKDGSYEYRPQAQEVNDEKPQRHSDVRRVARGHR